MKLIKPSYKIINQESGLEGIYRNIELAGRNCYKSEPVDGVTPEAFVERLIKSKHLSVLEHGTIYLKSRYDVSAIGSWNHSIAKRYSKNKYSVVNYDELMDFRGIYVTTNFRVLQENGWLDDLQYLCEPTEFHEKRVTVKFTSNIHFYKDLTRHRHMSFSIESTNYCNYSKGRFESELTFIIPVWLDAEEGYYEMDHDIVDKDGNSCEYPYPEDARVVCFWYKSNPNDKPIHLDYIKERDKFLCTLAMDEDSYMELIKSGWKARQAAEVLPQATKADVIVTGFVSDWQHIFNLRTSIIAETGQPHPELSRLMDPLFKEFKERKLI